MDKIRLSKLMAERGICSRREADRYIERGWVSVDGAVIDVLGTRVNTNSQIELTPAAHRQQQQLVTILLNKPVGYVSAQAEDGYLSARALITTANRYRKDTNVRRFHSQHRIGLAPAGRLDIDSRGLLILTQDGRIAKRLIGPDSMVEKEYLVRVDGRVTAETVAQLRHGLELDGRRLRRAQVEHIASDRLKMILIEGRKRQIRRMCELVDLKAVALKRVRIGRVRLDGIPEGQWRFLGPNENF